MTESARKTEMAKAYDPSKVDAAGPGARSVRGARVGMGAQVPRRDLAPARAPRRLVRLGARGVHDGRRAAEGGAHDIREASQRRVDLPRRADHQLVPPLPDGTFGPRGGARRARREPMVREVPVRGGRRGDASWTGDD